MTQKTLCLLQLQIMMYLQNTDILRPKHFHLSGARGGYCFAEILWQPCRVKQSFHLNSSPTPRSGKTHLLLYVCVRPGGAIRAGGDDRSRPCATVMAISNGGKLPVS